MIVIIPYANNPTDFAVLLTQLQSQKVPPTGIYVADNSADGSGLAIVKRYQWNVPIVVEPHAGTIQESWNAGIKFAAGDDVVILNDDVMIPNDFIEVMDIAAHSGEADMYCPGEAGFPPVRGVRQFYQWLSERTMSSRMIVQQNNHYTPAMAGWCFVLPSKTIKVIGDFDTQFKIWYGDKDYETRIFKAAGQIMMIDGLGVHHFGTSSYSKIPKKEFNITNYEDQVKYEKKYGIVHKDLGWDPKPEEVVLTPKQKEAVGARKLPTDSLNKARKTKKSKKRSLK